MKKVGFREASVEGHGWFTAELGFEPGTQRQVCEHRQGARLVGGTCCGSGGWEVSKAEPRWGGGRRAGQCVRKQRALATAGRRGRPAPPRRRVALVSVPPGAAGAGGRRVAAVCPSSPTGRGPQAPPSPPSPTLLPGSCQLPRGGREGGELAAGSPSPGASTGGGEQSWAAAPSLGTLAGGLDALCRGPGGLGLRGRLPGSRAAAG